MTVYVDSMLMSASVYNPGSGRTHSSRWSHLFSDQLNPAELHAFAQSIGLRRSWFQEGRDLLDREKPDPVQDHYDVTEFKRRVAIKAGAVPVDCDRAVSIWRAKRAALRG